MFTEYSDGKPGMISLSRVIWWMRYMFRLKEGFVRTADRLKVIVLKDAFPVMIELRMIVLANLFFLFEGRHWTIYYYYYVKIKKLIQYSVTPFFISTKLWNYSKHHTFGNLSPNRYQPTLSPFPSPPFPPRTPNISRKESSIPKTNSSS